MDKVDPESAKPSPNTPAALSRFAFLIGEGLSSHTSLRGTHHCESIASGLGNDDA